MVHCVHQIVGTTMDDQKRRLLWHGMFLFLLGLITGLVEPQFHNLRMGLAAHLEGLMNGILLLALGAIWSDVKLSPRPKSAAYWCGLFGTYGNWLVTTFAAPYSFSGDCGATRRIRSVPAEWPWQSDTNDQEE